MTDLIGQMLGHYQIVEQIGMGGMATVYKAYQANMDRYVAVKILPKQLAEDPQFIGRFEQEARTIAKLEHKHILPVYDYGEQDDQTYLVMRYIGTGTLKDLVARGPLALADAVEYFTQIADGLQYAHDHGVIHRDVKTSNVLIGEGRTCYLTDFGIAKLAEGAAHFTGTGVMIGTPSYMSPEQCHGLPADTRSDIYSLGIVLYEMLTGALPFEAETPVAVVLKQVNEPLPSPRNLNPSIPEAVEQVLFRALAKEPDDRYQSASDFSEALSEAFETFTERQTMSFAVPAAAHAATETRPATPTKPVAAVPARRPRWLLFAGIAAIALAAVIVGVLALSGGGEDGDDEEGAVVSADTPTGPAGETEVAAPVEETSIPAGETPPSVTEVAQVPDAVVENAGWTLYTSTRGEGDDDRRLVITDYGVWMSSPGGLVLWKKDGSGYTKYTSADGLVFNDIQTFALDSSGRLWAGGRNNQAGLMRLDLAPDGAITHVDYFDRSNSGLRSDWIWALIPLPDGTMYAASYESLVEYWNGSTWQAPAFPTTDSDLSALGDVLWTLVRARDGALWAGSSNGLARLDGETWQIIPPPEDLAAMSDPEIGFYTIYEDPLDGAFWMGIYSNSDSNHYVRRLIPPADESGAWTWQNTEDWVPYPLRDALRASDGSLWLVGYDRVVQVVADGTRRNEFVPGEDLSGNETFHIAEDVDGTIWLSGDAALFRYDGRRWLPFTIPNEPANQDVAAMQQAPDGSLWFVAGYGSLLKYANESWEFVEYLDTQPYDLALQGDAVWVASRGGLIRWENGAIRRYTVDDGLSNNEVLSLAIDPLIPDWLWVGTMKGLNVLNTADGTITTWTREEDTFPGPAISMLYFDTQGVLWIGTGYYEEWTGPGEGALVRMTEREKGKEAVWEIAAAPDKPLLEDDSWVESIAMDDQGRLWVGTNTRLYLYEADRWRRYTSEDAAPDGSRITSIAPVGDVVWVGTTDGLYRLDSFGWLQLGREGAGNEFITGLYHAADGTLWVLTEAGIAQLTGDPYAIH